MMDHRKNQTLILFSFLLLLLIPIFCKATDQQATATEDASGEGAPEVPRPVLRLGHGASPNEGPEEGDESDSAVSQVPAAAAEDSEEEEMEQQSTPSSVAAVGKDSNHLPRDLEEPESEESEEDDSEEDDSEEHDTEEPETEAEGDELTTVLAVSLSSLPLAPIPPADKDHEDNDSSPNNETLRPEPSRTVAIWDGTSEPDRELSSNEPEHPVHPTEDKPVSQPERPVNQPEKPHSEELHGNGANGNGHSKENDEDDSNSEVKAQEDRPGAKYDPVMSAGNTSSSSSMAWVVVFAVVSSALLISGMYESESDRDSSCHFGVCRHNFDDFNPYAWPPTPAARRNEITPRPIT